MDPKSGRCAILFPHGVLFRREEQEMRQKLLEQDAVECVLGLGPNLFYNSPMEACVVICRSQKPKARRGKVLFIDALKDVARERATSFLKPEHQNKIESAYRTFAEVDGFAKVATLAEIAAKDYSLSIPLYVGRAEQVSEGEEKTLPQAWKEWETSGKGFWKGMDQLVERLDEMAKAKTP